MNCFEHRYILRLGKLSITIKEKYLFCIISVLKRILKRKCIYIEIKRGEKQ